MQFGDYKVPSPTGPIMPHASALSVHLGLIAVQLMFATLPIAGKLIYDEQGPHLTPMAVAAARAVGAAVALWLVLLLTRGPVRIASGADVARFALFGFLGVFVNQVLFLGGLRDTAAVKASVLVTTIPVFTALAAIVLRQERARRHTLIGIALGCAGAVVVGGLDRFDLGSRTFTGNVKIIVNALAYALYLIWSRPLLARYSPLTAITWIFTFGAMFTAPLGWSALVADAPGLDARGWWTLAFIVAIPTIGAYVVNLWALKYATATLVSIYVYLQPIVSAVLAVAMLDERVDARLLAGAALIFAGIWLATGTGRRSESSRTRRSP